MKKAFKTLLILYCVVVTVFVTFGTANLAWESKNPLFFLLFFPIFVHFGLLILKPHSSQKIFIYYSFILTTIMTLTGFVSARSIGQLGSALLFLPLCLYFLRLVLPRKISNPKSHKKPSTGFVELNVTKQKEELPKLELIEGEEIPPKKERGEFDLDRRMFLKLIGSAGITIFLFSIFTKKAEAAFFGSVPGPGTVAVKDSLGAAIDPAIKQPTDGYTLAQIDDALTVIYYGYLDKTGNWYILKEDVSASTYRYFKGASSFTTNWTNRASLAYDFFDVIF